MCVVTCSKPFLETHNNPLRKQMLVTTMHRVAYLRRHYLKVDFCTSALLQRTDDALSAETNPLHTFHMPVSR